MSKRVKVPASAVDTILTTAAATMKYRQKQRKLARKWRGDIARSAQVAPDTPWSVWYVRGGRGSGKTRTGAEWLREQVQEYPNTHWAIVAPTFSDARDKCVEGPSGILKALQREGPSVVRYNRSPQNAHIITSTGCTIWLDGADDGAPRVQGYNLAGAWADEIGLWKKWRMAWDESLGFATRIYPSRIVATGTPKVGHKLVKRLLDDSRKPDGTTAHTLLRTEDNIDNLDADRIRQLKERYAGTRLERQELEGEFFAEVENALWTVDGIDAHRVDEDAVLELSRIVVAIDPAVTATDDSDETGIVIAGVMKHKDGMHHVYILRDRSGHYSPNGWAKLAVHQYRRYEADKIIAERNNGGDMVETTIHNIDPNVPVKTIHASRGKVVRAEPVAALYEQGRVHHVGTFYELESQMVAMAADEADEGDDRVDALVYAVTELINSAGKGMFIGWA